MIALDRHYGPWTGRVWGLLVNLAANALALYGLVGYLRDGSHLPHLIIGSVATVACVVILAIPSR